MAPGLTEHSSTSGTVPEPLAQKLVKRLKNDDGSPLYPDYMRKIFQLQNLNRELSVEVRLIDHFQ